MTNEVETGAEYDDAFAKFSESELPALSTAPKEEEPAEEEGEGAAVAAAAEEAEAPGEEGEEPVEGGEEGEEPASADKPEKAEKPAKPAGEEGKPDTAAELLNKLDALLESRKQEQAPAEPEPKEPPAQEQPVYTPEEQAFLEEYENEWGDVSKAESLKRRVEYEKLVQYVFNEVAAVLRPMTQDLQALSQERQKAQYRQVVPEYDTLQTDLMAWAESQPTYLRAAYQNVIQNGTPEDVADLVERYKRDTAASTEVESPKQKATELPPSAKKAAQALAPVSSKRSSVVAAEPDKNDFDGAFEKFAAMT